MTDKFNAYVVIRNEEGKGIWFAPGDDVPDWAGDQVEPHVIAKPANEQGKKEKEDYHVHTIPQLRQIAAERGLELDSNKKSEIIEQLEEDDATHTG